MSFIIPPQTQISSERLLFRQLTPEDEDAWMEYFNSPEALTHMPYGLGSREDCKEWIVRQRARYDNGGHGLHVLIHKETGDFIGQCGLLIQEVDGKEELEIGYHLLPRFWGQGYASEAAIACKNFAFTHNINDLLISLIAPTNFRSQNVAGRNGMKALKTTTFKGKEAIVFGVGREEWERSIN